MDREKQRRILENQIEIMWTINMALGKLLPDLVGRGGELDRMREDLAMSCKSSKLLIEDEKFNNCPKCMTPELCQRERWCDRNWNGYR